MEKIQASALKLEELNAKFNLALYADPAPDSKDVWKHFSRDYREYSKGLEDLYSDIEYSYRMTRFVSEPEKAELEKNSNRLQPDSTAESRRNLATAIASRLSTLIYEEAPLNMVGTRDATESLIGSLIREAESSDMAVFIETFQRESAEKVDQLRFLHEKLQTKIDKRDGKTRKVEKTGKPVDRDDSSYSKDD